MQQSSSFTRLECELLQRRQCAAGTEEQDRLHSDEDEGALQKQEGTQIAARLPQPGNHQGARPIQNAVQLELSGSRRARGIAETGGGGSIETPHAKKTPNPLRQQWN